MKVEQIEGLGKMPITKFLKNHHYENQGINYDDIESFYDNCSQFINDIESLPKAIDTDEDILLIFFNHSSDIDKIIFYIEMLAIKIDSESKLHYKLLWDNELTSNYSDEKVYLEVFIPIIEQN